MLFASRVRVLVGRDPHIIFRRKNKNNAGIIGLINKFLKISVSIQSDKVGDRMSIQCTTIFSD